LDQAVLQLQEFFLEIRLIGRLKPHAIYVPQDRFVGQVRIISIAAC
jgi:hypothetical protein